MLKRYNSYMYIQHYDKLIIIGLHCFPSLFCPQFGVYNAISMPCYFWYNYVVCNCLTLIMSLSSKHLFLCHSIPMSVLQVIVIARVPGINGSKRTESEGEALGQGMFTLP